MGWLLDGVPDKYSPPMKYALVGCLLVVIISAGCRKRPAPPTSVSADPGTPSSAAPNAQTPKGAFVPALAVPPDSPAAIAQTELDRKLASGNPQLQVQVLDELLQAWVMSKNELPKDLEEFVRAGMLTRLPVPPPGKLFMIDRKSGHVVLANQ